MTPYMPTAMITEFEDGGDRDRRMQSVVLIKARIASRRLVRRLAIAAALGLTAMVSFACDSSYVVSVKNQSTIPLFLYVEAHYSDEVLAEIPLRSDWRTAFQGHFLHQAGDGAVQPGDSHSVTWIRDRPPKKFSVYGVNGGGRVVVCQRWN